MVPLLLLSRLRIRGAFRKLRLRLTSVKGVALALMFLLFLGMMLLPRIVQLGGHGPQPDKLRGALWFLHPAALLAFAVFGFIGGRLRNPIAFSMPEVEFLFPGPFTRRQLMSYKLLVSMASTFGFAVMMPLFLGPQFGLWLPAAFLGMWLTTTFIMWAAILGALAGQWLHARFGYWQQAIWLTLGILALASAYQAGVFHAELELVERARRLESSTLAQVVLAPFVVMNRAITAVDFGTFAQAAGAALLINVLVAWAILKLDTNFLESSMEASQKRSEMIERLRRTGGLPTIGARSKPRMSFPVFPRLRGVGTVAWRQSLELVRGSARLIFLIPALIGPGVGMVMASRGTSGNADPVSQSLSHGGEALIGITISAPLIIALLISLMLPLALRTDLNHVEVLRSLPLTNLAIVGGSSAAAVLYLSLVQCLCVGTVVALLGWNWGAALGIGLAIPVNLLLVSVDNVLVTLFPSIRRIEPGDVFAGLRVMLVNLVKMLVAVVAASLASLGILAVWLIWGEAYVGWAIAAGVILLVEGLAVLWLSAWLFGRYDPSTQLDEPS